MSVPDPRGSYRAPLLQFIWDWNVAEDQPALIVDPPFYEGDDSLLLPAVSVIVHALGDRDGIRLPEWVLGHRAPADVMAVCCVGNSGPQSATSGGRLPSGVRLVRWVSL